MQFKAFLCLVEDIASLVENDTVEWNPDTVASFKGAAGINQDTSHGAEQQKRLSVQPKQGDIVIVADHTGKMTPTLITGLDQREAMLVNTNQALRLKRDIASLKPAAANFQQQFGSKYPGRNVWQYSADNNSTDYLR